MSEDGRDYFTRIHTEKWATYVCTHLRPVVEFLREQAVTIVDVFEGHPKDPNVEICVSAPIPTEALRRAFALEDREPGDPTKGSRSWTGSRANAA